MSDINAIIASIGDAIVLANKQSKEELKSYIKSQLDTYKFSGTQIRQNSLPGAAIGRWGVPYTKVSGLQAEVARIAVAEISTATIDYAQINNVRIKTADIDDAAITTAKIGNAAITSAKIGDAEIGTAQIANAAIKTANIDLGAITTALIQEGAVGSVQIANGSITDAKIVELTANKITAGELAVERLVISGTNKSIVYALNNMGDLVSTAVDTIDGDTLTPRTITADKIVAESITSNEMSANSITTNKIVALAVTADKIAANAITANKIEAGAITADKIAAGAVTAKKLAADSVTADKIAAGAINAEHLDAENIFAENANIQELIAENLDAEKFFAREGVISHLTLDYVTPLNDYITIRTQDLEDEMHAFPLVDTVDVEYYLSDSSSSLTGGDWSTTPPPWVNGKYYWSRTKTSYLNAETTYSNPACITGAEGAPGESVYKVEILSSLGNVFKNGVIQTTLRAVVYEGDDDVTASIDANRFRWVRASNDPAGDITWNAAHFGGAKEIEITRDDVTYLATFQCAISKE